MLGHRHPQRARCAPSEGKAVLPEPAPGEARRGLCLVIAAPSGGGKSTIADALRASDGNLAHSVSVTTRPARPREVDGQHYHFRDDAAFRRMADGGELVEWARVFGRSYGTPRAPVEAALAAGRDMVFDIDWQGHRQLRAALPGDVVGVFVLPPALSVLEDRLRGRGQDDAAEIRRRMEAALDECSHWGEFDHVVVNESIEQAVAETRAVLWAARTTAKRQKLRAQEIIGRPGALPWTPLGSRPQTPS